MDAVKMTLLILSIIFVFIVAVSGILLWIIKLSLKNETKKKGKKVKYITFTKRWFKRILVNGIVWVYLSYILAFCKKEQIAETLSITAITTILGAFITYCIKSFGEKKIGKEKEDYEDVFTETHE